MEKIVLTTPIKMACIPLVTSSAREVCKMITAHQLPIDFCYSVELAVCEACTNMVRHSDQDTSEAMTVTFEILSDRLVTHLMDKGRGFDLDRVPEPDFGEPAEGGYGVYLIRTKMDEVTYCREGQTNTLSMTKYFTESTYP